MLLDSIHIHDDEYERLTRNLEYCKSMLEHQKIEFEQLRIHRQTLSQPETKELIARYNELHLAIIGGVDIDLEQFIKDRIFSVESSLSHYRNLLRNTQEQLSEYGDPNPWACTKAELKAAIDKLDNILPRFTSVGEDFIGSFIRFAFKPLLMHVHNANAPWVQADDPAIQLGRVVVKLYPKQNKARIRKVAGDKQAVLFASHGVHPHLSDNGAPCFGDFNGPIYESLNDKDFVSTVVLVQEFLQQADASDVYGSYWMYGLTHLMEDQLDIAKAYINHRGAYFFYESGIRYIVARSTTPGEWTFEITDSPCESEAA